MIMQRYLHHLQSRRMGVCCFIVLMKLKGLVDKIGDLKCPLVRILLVPNVRFRWLTLAIALSHSYVVACTSKGYVRVYTTQGIPVRLYRQKYMPVVTCATWKNYVMIIGNGGAQGDGYNL